MGERSKNEGILDIGSSQNMEALIEVYESDINRVFISQNVELSSENGGFEKLLKGKVIRKVLRLNKEKFYQLTLQEMPILVLLKFWSNLIKNL